MAADQKIEPSLAKREHYSGLGVAAMRIAAIGDAKPVAGCGRLIISRRKTQLRRQFIAFSRFSRRRH
jgi:hypothetical protein